MPGVCTICARVIESYKATVIYDGHETEEDVCKNCVKTINWFKEEDMPIEVIITQRKR